MAVAAMDHVAIPAGDAEGLIRFYRALGFAIVGEAEWRSGEMPVFAIGCGEQKINVHDRSLWEDSRFTLRGPSAAPGCGDFCFVWEGTVEEASSAIAKAGGELIEGPVGRQGGRGGGLEEGMSVYTRDPDGNLVEFIVYG